jgi:RNA polymerase primary sigma factor
MARKEGKTKKIVGEESKSMGYLDNKRAEDMVVGGINTSNNTNCFMSPSGTNNPRSLREHGKPDHGRLAADYEPEASKNLLWAYLKEVGRIPLLNQEEERGLAEEIQKVQGELVRRLLKLELTIDELDMIRKRERHVSDELIATIMRILEKLEEEKRISRDQRALLSEVMNLYGRLTRLKGEMLKRNLRLVIKIAKGYIHAGMSLLDLVQEGNLGLMKAVSKYDYRRGSRFSTYATWWIRQSIQRTIVEKERTIRIPAHLMEKRQRLTKTYTSLVKKYGKAPRPEEVAEKARVPVKAAQKVLFSLPEAVSLETPVGEDSSLGYFIEDEKSPSPFDVMERKEIRRMAEKILSDLSPRQAEILRLRFGIGGNEEHTLEEIGRKFGISRERVRQLEKKGINRLRHSKEKFSNQVESVPGLTD